MIWKFITFLVTKLDPEKAHQVTLFALKLGFHPRLNKIKKLTKSPIVAIGGINFNNYKKLLLNNANLLAISSYVWNNKKYKPFETIDKIK